MTTLTTEQKLQLFKERLQHLAATSERDFAFIKDSYANGRKEAYELAVILMGVFFDEEPVAIEVPFKENQFKTT